MPEELKNITNGVMDQIHLGKVKMRPKIYFIIGSVLTFIGLISSVTISIFFVGLIRFSLRAHGPIGQSRLDQMVANFPWWIALIAIFSLVMGLWLISQYDFSYKKEPWLIILGFVLLVLVTGWMVDIAGLNDSMLRYGPTKGVMKNYFQRNNLPEKIPNWKK